MLLLLLKIGNLKLACLGKKLRVGVLILKPQIKKEKEKFLMEFDILVVFYEKNLLSKEDSERMKVIKKELDEI